MDEAWDRLEEALDGLGESSEFLASGSLPATLPGLEVEGVGPVAMPVSAQEAQRLIAVAGQAPYGRGTETIVDTSVRRVWQIEPARFALRNPGWEAQLKSMVTAVKQRLAISGEVRHELYKLLVYEPGSFFAPHRDTEKTPGMFATLVVCLPSRHEGGTLVVRHEDRCERIDFGGPESEFRLGYAAFYADCRHEITPVESGYRVCLVYNLALDRAKSQPTAPQSAQTVAKTADALQGLFADPEMDLCKIVIPFDHQYTEEGLHPAALKGADRPLLDVLARAAALLGYDCSLALATHYQTGSVDLGSWRSPYYRSRRSRSYYRDDAVDDDDAESAEMDEVFDEFIVLNHWLDLDGRKRPLGEIHVSDDELYCGEDREGWAVQKEIQEATGNEGATLERWYRQCGVVIWPRDRFFRILASEGQAVAFPELERMALVAEEEESVSKCRDFIREILASWTSNLSDRERTSYCGRLLDIIERLGTADLLRQFLRVVPARDFDGSEGGFISRLCQRFGWEALRPDLEAFLERQRSAPKALEPVRLVSLLAPLYDDEAEWTAERRAVCESLAQGLGEVLDRSVTQPDWGYRYAGESPVGLVANAVRVFALGAAPEAMDRFLKRALRGELGCGLHEVLGPDLKSMAGWLAEVPSAAPAYSRLRGHCLARLREATAQPVEEPADWRRSAELSCKCEDCQALARFLADPGERSARFPLAEARRRHLHDQIDRHKCDCTHETERKGRPYTLVCNKTKASYERREQQYQKDSRLLEALQSLPAG